jgi:hypothetical protein
VTFIWRDDRPWRVTADAVPTTRRERLKRLLTTEPRPRVEQSELVSELAETLRRELPALDFAVAGLAGDVGGGELPRWVLDLRRPSVDEAAERAWCERYAASHVVVGVHCSNMLLPSAQAGAAVELIRPERWGNFTQDVLFRDARDCRETFFRYRFVDDSTPPAAVAQLVGLILKGRTAFRQLMNVP